VFQKHVLQVDLLKGSIGLITDSSGDNALHFNSSKAQWLECEFATMFVCAFALGSRPGLRRQWVHGIQWVWAQVAWHMAFLEFVPSLLVRTYFKGQV
jgi:hypothetical protein